MTLPIAARWRTSSYSNGMGGECVEVALTSDGVSVRDSKARQTPPISVRPHAWQEFLQVVQSHGTS
ncbi:DUF397 domain-containing protein [Streptomyces sp. VRA16 Mangrove soil]|uniref:DUF397 domain-containing protein n=1 Tax=Streptomyces sp. VRA16 Mangrove soil TaxID=2817434 RepID=UPI001A9EDC8F|nr:DUF397 domain-containing protein [Streptomyces sp. VRA16 Mangrove soil]MBO1337696.1 DUF397 domain-containing protein [Streptomyces sp. VRA16 Mangrove soil]